jgi:hypothetical protein
MKTEGGLSTDQVNVVWAHIRKALTQGTDGMATSLHPRGTEIEWVKMFVVGYEKLIDELIARCKRSMTTDDIMMAYGMPQMFDRKFAPILLEHCASIEADYRAEKLHFIDESAEGWTQAAAEADLVVPTLSEIRHVAELMKERTKLQAAFQEAVQTKRFDEAHHLITAIALTQEIADDPRGELELLNLRVILSASEGDIPEFLRVIKSIDTPINAGALKQMIPGIVSAAYIEGIRILSIGQSPLPAQQAEIFEIFWKSVTDSISRYIESVSNPTEKGFKEALKAGCISADIRLTFYPAMKVAVEIQWWPGKE